ncbi:polyadenylate-binding protein-interacting protein 1 [Lampetra fluviatilis]
MKTALSVHAKEFYPRVAGGAGASGCSPSGWVEEEEDEEEGGGGGGGGSAEAALHDFVRDFVSSLSVRPALYEAESPLFLDTLTACVSSEHSLLIVLHGIYEQALAESNFTYTAARLCNLLSQKLVVNSHAGTFRQHLLKRCHVEYESRELVAQGDAASRKRLHAYSIFLTELYLHLEVLSGSQRTRAAILRAGVKEVIHTLLAHPSDDNVTCSIKMLKLCGSVLEDDFRLEGKSSMDELMERMKSVVLDGSCER